MGALYAASSISLAVLEVLVHLRNVALVPEDYVVSMVTIPDELIAPFPETRGEARFNALIESEVPSREFGDNFLAGVGRGYWAMQTVEFPLVVQVPSVVIPQEWNYLMSTEPDPLSRRPIEWGAPETFRFDPRIVNPAWR